MTSFFESFFEGAWFRKSLIFIFLLIALFSSFDVALHIHFLSFNLRFAQILIFMLLGLFPFYFFFRRRIHLDQALLFFLAWLLTQLFFLQNSVYLLRGVFYWIWLLSFGSLLFYGEELGRLISNDEFDGFLKIYALIFVLIALFGLFQSLAVFFGLMSKGPFQTQGWHPLLFVGIPLPRINGFNYEPSYFVTYLLPGVTLLFYFARHGKNKVLWTFLFVFVSSVVFFSTARTGIFTLILVLAILFLYAFLTRFPIKKYFRFYLSAILLFLFGLFVLALIPKTRELLLWPLHYVSKDSSFNSRVFRQVEVAGLFFAHPFSGVTLGGIAPSMVSAHHTIVDGNQVCKSFEGNNVFFEILASGGLIAYFFFLLFQSALFAYSLRIYRKLSNEADKDLIFLFSLAVLIQLIMLFFNQNILRIYYWTNVASLLLIQRYLSRKRKSV